MKEEEKKHGTRTYDNDNRLSRDSFSQMLTIFISGYSNWMEFV